MDLTEEETLRERKTPVRAAAQLKRVVGRVPSLWGRARPVTQEQHNERVLYIEMLFQAISSAGAFSFLAIFLVRLDAPNWLVGVYTSAPALLTLLAVLPMGALVQRQRSLVRVVNAARMTWRTVIASFALLVYLPVGIAPYIMVVAESLLSIPGAALNVAQTTLLGQATSPERRPRMLSTRMAIHGLVAAAVGFLAGQWLDAVAYPLNYQLLFVSAFVAGIGSVLTLSRIKLPEVTTQQIAARTRVSIRQMIALVKATPPFRDYAITAFVFRMGQNLPLALFAIYRVRTLGASDAWIGVLLTVHRVLSVFAYVLLSRVLNQAKYRKRLWISCVGMALFPLAMALARTPEQLLYSAVLGGIFAPGMDIFMTDTLFRVSTEEDRPTFVAANTFLANVTAFAAPLLGTLLADVTFIRLALVAATVLRAIGGLAFWRLGVGSE